MPYFPPAAVGGTASGSIIFLDEGNVAGTATHLNVVGSSGTVAYSGGTATLTLSGGGATGIPRIDSADHPDRPPGSPSAYDDEFDAGTLDAKWTHAGTGTEAFAGSLMVITHSASSTDETYRQTFVPGAGVAFTVTVRVTSVVLLESVDYIGLEALTSGGSTIASADIRTNGAAYTLHKDAPGSGSVQMPAGGPHSGFYMRMSRDASDVWTFEMSWDGLAWSTWGLATGSSSSTVGQVGFRYGQTSNKAYKRAAVDWFRIT